MIDTLKIAVALEKLVDRAIADFEAQLDVLEVPQSIRGRIWDGVVRYAKAKAEECK